MKKIRVVIFTIFCGLLVFGFTATNSFAQRDGENAVIELTKDARQNGYKFWKKGEKIFVQAINVVDPITKKRLEGLKELGFRCKETDQMQKLFDIVFKVGSSGKLLMPCVAEDIDGEALAVLVVNKL